MKSSKPTQPTQEEKDFVMRLLKAGGAGSEDKQKIFNLYKKYIDATHLSWVDTSCGGCSSSILRMWNLVKDYVMNN
jgi:hypothetical protein